MAGLISALVAGLVSGGYIVLGMIFLTVIGWFTYQNTGYPIKIIIWEQIGNTFRLGRPDRGKVIKHESGAMIFKGKSKINGINFKGFKYSLCHATHKGGYVLELIKTEKGSFNILSREGVFTENNKPELEKVTPEAAEMNIVNREDFDKQLHSFKFEVPKHDLLYWNNIVKRDARARYSNEGWKKHLPMIIHIAGIVLVLMMQMISWHYMTAFNERVMAANVATFNKLHTNDVAAPAPQQLNSQSAQAQNLNMPSPLQNIPFANTIQGTGG